MNYQLKISLILCFAFFAGAHQLHGQETDDEEPTPVIIRNSNNYIAEILKDKDIQYLKGDVQLVHDSVFMYCDSAIVIKNQLTAIGEVVIIKPDSINIFSDSLYYDGDIKIAELFYGVVLENSEKQLFTESLLYDMNTEIATFVDTAILKKNTMRLSSIEGLYDMKKKMAFFYKDVTIVDDDFTLYSDSLKYDIDIDRAYFIGPSYITQGERQIYCESGYYDVDEGRAHFSQHAIIRKKDQTASAESIFYSEQDSTVTFTGDAEIIDSSSVTRGDIIEINDKTGDIHIRGNAYYATDDQVITGPHIYYNKKTEDVKLEGRATIFQTQSQMTGDTINYTKETDFGDAKGNVVWIDTIEDRSILADRVFYRDSIAYYKAVTVDQRPLFIQDVDGDSLFLSADTLIRAEPTDTTGYMMAIGNVKIFKTDLQAICDSLYYSDIDSSFTLYQDPVCWSDTTQFIGDTIRLFLRDGELREIQSRTNAFISIQDPFEYYDQIKGRLIQSFLDSNQLQKMYVKGNAQSIYMVKDEEDAYVGINKTLCSHINFYFKDKDLSDVRYYGEPDSEMIPFAKASEADFKLEGFIWRDKDRPGSVEELRKKMKVVQSNTPLIPVEKKADEFEKGVNTALEDIYIDGINSDNKKDSKTSKKKDVKKPR